MTVPKTSMHEDGGSPLGEDDVGRTWEIPAVKAGSESESM